MFDIVIVIIILAIISVSSWCHPVIFSSSKIQNGLPFWCRLTQLVLENRPLNGCSSSVVISVTVWKWTRWCW